MLHIRRARRRRNSSSPRPALREAIPAAAPGFGRLAPPLPRISEPESFTPIYGDVTRCNRERTILNALSDSTLHSILNDLAALMGTSCAIYERNGDYAAGIFSSGWCRALDRASFERCGTSDLAEALCSGKWLCHESCWTQASKVAIETRAPVDIECSGGLHLYAIPITLGDEVIGSINFGYGDPPSNPEKLRAISSDYCISTEDLDNLARAYESRPPFIVEQAKRRLEVAARFIALIVERTRSEKRLLEAKALAEAANEAKSRFLANASHELRTPLNAVIGFLDLALVAEMSPKMRSYLTSAGESAQNLLELINDLLDLSRAEAGKVSFESKPFDPREVIGQVFRTLALSAYGKGLELFSDVPPEVPARLVGDSHRMRQVLTNLLSNAVKFTDEGSVCIRTRLVAKSGTQALLRFSVEDSGIGIAPAEQQHVFQPFVQAASSARDGRPRGTGLGLPIAAAIVNLMGGTMSLESEPGKGSTFHFSVTLEYEENEEAETRTSPAAKCARACIVSQNAHVRAYLSDALRDFGLVCASHRALEDVDAHLTGGCSEDEPLLVVDLPGEEGLQADWLETLFRRFGGLRRAVYLVSPISRGRSARLPAGTPIVEKPLALESLLAAVARALEMRTERVSNGPSSRPA